MAAPIIITTIITITAADTFLLEVSLCAAFISCCSLAMLDSSAALELSMDSFSAASFASHSGSSYVVIFSNISLPVSLPTVVLYNPKSAQLYS